MFTFSVGYAIRWYVEYECQNAFVSVSTRFVQPILKCSQNITFICDFRFGPHPHHRPCATVAFWLHSCDRNRWGADMRHSRFIRIIGGRRRIHGLVSKKSIHWIELLTNFKNENAIVPFGTTPLQRKRITLNCNYVFSIAVCVCLRPSDFEAPKSYDVWFTISM